jgi:hypothetical protein
VAQTNWPHRDMKRILAYQEEISKIAVRGFQPASLKRFFAQHPDAVANTLHVVQPPDADNSLGNSCRVQAMANCRRSEARSLVGLLPSKRTVLN